MGIVWPWTRRGSRPYCPTRPDGWSNQEQFYVPRPLAPVNDVTAKPITKTLETIPSGERREIFNLSGSGRLILFRNTGDIPAEISEIFIIGLAVGTIQIFNDEQAQTPVIPMSANQSYSDAGFSLAQGSAVFCDIGASGTMSISGFLRWRYI
jgi:hypothetical protein